MEEFITAKEICKVLKVSKAWPCRAAKNGIIPHYRLGNLLRFSQRDVEAYIEKCRTEGTGKKVRKEKDEVHSSETKYTVEDKTHSQELPHVRGVCRKCLKRTDGKIDYLTNGLCRTCRHRR